MKELTFDFLDNSLFFKTICITKPEEKTIFNRIHDLSLPHSCCLLQCINTNLEIKLLNETGRKYITRNLVFLLREKIRLLNTVTLLRAIPKSM